MKRAILIILFCMTATVSYFGKDWVQNFIGQSFEDDEYTIMMKQDLISLWMAYPENIVGIEKDPDNHVYLVMKSGKKILYDDKRQKTMDQQLAHADLQDMLEQIYPLGGIVELMDVDFDPGRARSYGLLKEIYGGSKESVQSNLMMVKMGYQNLQFNKNNKAAVHLDAVMKELVPLGNARQDIRACLYPPGGTFNYRTIAGTGQLSPHAFGIAIDLAKDDRDYWQWASREAGEKRLKSYPKEIVEIFEKNNFIWGGKWGHFDILHFEYRPELIIKSKYFAGQNQRDQAWHAVLPREDAIGHYIKVIDEAIN